MIFTTTEAAKIIGVTAKTISRWCDEATWQMPHRKSSRGAQQAPVRFIEASAMLAWLDRTPGALLAIPVERRNGVMSALRLIVADESHGLSPTPRSLK